MKNSYRLTTPLSSVKALAGYKDIFLINKMKVHVALQWYDTGQHSAASVAADSNRLHPSLFGPIKSAGPHPRSAELFSMVINYLGF